MKVKLLIERLQKFDPEAQVKLHHYNGDNALFVIQLKEDKSTVWIEGNGDSDLKSQLMSLKETAVSEMWEEDMYYQVLIDSGITAEDLKKCFGEMDANVFTTYCEEHGLI